MEKRLVSFAGSTVAVEYDGSLAAGIVDFLFGALTPYDGFSGEQLTTFSLVPGLGPDRIMLLREGVQLYEGYGKGVAAEMLLSYVSYELAEKSTGGMLFHAGALAWKDGLVLLPAGVGCGKSTLTLWLSMKGLGYLSDEAAFVPEGSEGAVPFRRPLNLKRSSGGVVEDLFELEKHVKGVLASSESDLIHPSVLTAGPHEESLPVRLVIFPRYDPGAKLSWEPLSAAMTGQELMQYLVNARNLEDHGFSEAVRLAKAARGYKLAYSDFDQIAGRIDELLDLRSG